MKIAYVYDCVYPYVKGGVERRIWEVSRRLAERGHEVHVYGMKYWKGARRIEREGVSLHGVCPPRPLYTRGKRSISGAIFFGSHLLPPLLSDRFDLVDCQAFPYFSSFPVKAHSFLRATPFVITWHEVWGDYWHEYLGWKGFLGRWIESWVASLSTHHIAVSPATQWDLYDLGVRRKIEVVPNGIDVRRIQGIPAADSPSDVIFVGRLIPEKHVDLLLQALAILREALPDIRCAIVGDGPERERLIRLSRDLGLSGSVSFSGFLDSSDAVMGAMKASKVFVLPSTREGFGMSALEAMACGLPVVTVDHPQNAARMLVDGRNGLLSSLSPEDLGEKIRMALDAPAAVRAACRETAQKYDWDAIVGKLESVYNGIAAADLNR
ncbi:MAG: glycosyltransferase family 4 protein [Methanomicrobiales archaeon]|nr:glycosyltransferase family 4 protein [Methanomicrobiales archaeon]